MNVAIRYALVTTAIGAAAVVMPFLWLQLLFAWGAFALLIVTLGYAFDYHQLFRKRANGRIPRAIRWLLWPFILGCSLYNRVRRYRDKGPAFHAISEQVYVGSRLFPDDAEALKDEGIKAILDVTAEFDGLNWSDDDDDLYYLNVPSLDHRAPPILDVQRAINWIHHHVSHDRKVIIHCALGRGRSVFVCAAYLLAQQQQDVDELLSHIYAQRPIARLNRWQAKRLKRLYQQDKLTLGPKAALIVNPVAGGGKWEKFKSDIVQRLSQSMQLEFIKTRKDFSATQAAEQALNKGFHRIIAAGGDGTVNAVAAALVHKDVELGIIPLGTANALSQVLLGQRSQLVPVDTACDVIARGHQHTIDSIRCNEETSLLLVGLGFESAMIGNADRKEKDNLGQMAYVKCFWDALNAGQSLHLTYQLDDEHQFEEDTASVVIANAAPFSSILARGGGEPRFDDGLLDMTLVPAQDGVTGHLTSLIELVFESFTETKLPSKTHHFTPKKVCISSDKPLSYVIDGEPREADVLNITAQPQSLKVLMPEA